jgi:hypothetical protein
MASPLKSPITTLIIPIAALLLMFRFNKQLDIWNQAHPFTLSVSFGLLGVSYLLLLLYSDDPNEGRGGLDHARRVELQGGELCRKCQGTGQVRDRFDLLCHSKRRCPDCNGRGDKKKLSLHT